MASTPIYSTGTTIVDPLRRSRLFNIGSTTADCFIEDTWPAKENVMRKVTRREFSAARRRPWRRVLAPVRALAAAVKPVKIRGVDIFPIEIPVSPAEHDAGVDHRFTVVRVETDAGVRGYSFAGPPSPRALAEVRTILVGQDLFAIERHLRHGLIRWGGVEHALWDAIGKVAGQPVSKLLGGTSDRVKAYVTCVWKGKLDQSHVATRTRPRWRPS